MRASRRRPRWCRFVRRSRALEPLASASRTRGPARRWSVASRAGLSVNLSYVQNTWREAHRFRRVGAWRVPGPPLSYLPSPIQGVSRAFVVRPIPAFRFVAGAGFAALCPRRSDYREASSFVSYHLLKRRSVSLSAETPLFLQRWPRSWPTESATACNQSARRPIYSFAREEADQRLDDSRQGFQLTVRPAG